MCSECGNEYSIKEYEELQAENEKLKKEVADYHQLQWQHDALIDENEKLKDKVEMHDFFWEGCGFDKMGFKNAISVRQYVDDLLQENKRLKCLALHAMSEYCFAQGTIIQIQLEFASQPIEEDVKMIHKVNIRDRWGEYFAEAYRNAKKALREGNES